MVSLYIYIDYNASDESARTAMPYYIDIYIYIYI